MAMWSETSYCHDNLFPDRSAKMLCYSIPTEIWEFSGTIPVRIWRDMPLPILFRYLLGKRIDARLTVDFWECPDDEGVEIYYDLEFLYSWHASEKSLPRRWLDGELCPEIKKNGMNYEDRSVSHLLGE